MADEPATVGRPSEFSQEIADTICERLVEPRSLRSICTDDDMPAQSMVFRWLAANEEFREQYAHAREAQADAIFDETLDIADDGSNDWMSRKRDDGSTAEDVVNHEHIARSKLRIETRKWMAGKLRPKVYGEKQTVDMNHNMSPEATEWLGLKPTS